jgi:hypothetical protein
MSGEQRIYEKNDFTWYKGAVDAQENGKLSSYLKDHPLVLNQVEPGFYRSKNREGRMTSVAFWHDTATGELRCHINGKPAPTEDPERLWQIFSYACKGPIKYTNYKNFIDTGKWLDESEVAAADRAAQAMSNDPSVPAPDSFEGLTKRLDALTEAATPVIKAGPASTKEEADRAADLKNQIVTVGKALEKAFEAEKAPIRVQVSQCQAKWTPHVNKAEEFKDALNIRVLTPYLAVQKAKLEQEQMAAAQLQREENAARPDTSRRGEAKGDTAKVGNFGRVTHLRENWFVDITDRAAFLAHVKDYPGITDALVKIANSFKTTRPEIPGLSYRKEDRAV